MTLNLYLCMYGDCFRNNYSGFSIAIFSSIIPSIAHHLYRNKDYTFRLDVIYDTAE